MIKTSRILVLITGEEKAEYAGAGHGPESEESGRDRNSDQKTT